MLVSGIATVIVCALLHLFERSVCAIPIAVASVLLLCILKRKSIKKHITIPTVCIISLLTLISFFAYNAENISPYLKYHNSSETICGKVLTTPQFKENYVLFTLQTDTIGNQKVNTKINIAWGNDYEQEIRLYDYITIKDPFITVPTDDSGNYDFTQVSDGILLSAECYDIEYLWDCEKTPYYYCLKFKEIITEKITLYMSENNGALLTGMLFGDKANLDYSTTQAFRNSGISHLLAVSGLHTSLWCGLLISLLSAFKIPEKLRNIVCLVFLILFCIISGFTPSVIRAALMMAVILIAPFFRRTPDSINSLGFAVTFLLLLNPYAVSSISFQLSVCATLGVLVAGNVDIDYLIRKIPFKNPRNAIKALLSSILISVFAGILTMPVSAYHFGVFSLASPISNLLCVQLAFYGMLSGTISTVTSFINIPFIKDITLLLFDITEFILDLVIHFAELVSQLRYCTIPVHTEYLIAGLFVTALFAGAGYIVYKFKNRNSIIKATAFVSVFALFFTIFIPLSFPSHRNTLTIADCPNGIQAIIRSGTRYAYIENTASEISDDTFNALPKATCESLEYYIPTYLSKTSINNILTVNFQYKPKEIIITQAVRNMAQSNTITVPENAVISTSGYFTLSEEITFEIVDTNSIKYAIIRGKGKTAFIHLYGDTDFSKYLSAEDCDIAVYNGALPSQLPESAETVIISVDDYNPIETSRLASQCTDFYITAKHGSIKIHF